MNTEHVLSAYRQSTGSIVQMFDSNYQPVKADDEPGIEQRICCHCSGNTNCKTVHANAMRESGYSGKYTIYQCELWVMF